MRIDQYGELAQLGEHLPCTQGVKSSNLLFSTMNLFEDSFLTEKFNPAKTGEFPYGTY